MTSGGSMPLFWLFHDGTFWVFAVTTVAAALAVVISQNVVRMAFWLIVSLGSTAGLFFSLNADFVGAAQLLIYVGGTLVLLIFGVMLTASGPFVKMKTSPGEGVLAGVVGVAAALFDLVFRLCGRLGQHGHFDRKGQSRRRVSTRRRREIRPARSGLSFLGARPDKDLGVNAFAFDGGLPAPVRNRVGASCWWCLVGAAYLARAKRRKETACCAVVRNRSHHRREVGGVGQRGKLFPNGVIEDGVLHGI